MKETPFPERHGIRKQILILIAVAVATQLAFGAALIRELSMAREQSHRLGQFHVATLEHAAAIFVQLRDLRNPDERSTQRLRELAFQVGVAEIDRHVAELEKDHREFESADFRMSLSRLRSEVSKLMLVSKSAEGIAEHEAEIVHALNATRIHAFQLAILHRESATREILEIETSRADNTVALATLGLFTFALLAGVAARTLRNVGERVRERDRTLDELRRSEERIRLLLDSSYDLICEFDFDGNLFFVNSRMAESRGLDPDDLSLTNSSSGVHPDDLAQMTADVAGAIETSSPVETTCRVRSANGGWLWLQSTIIPHETPGGEIRLIGLGRDITLSRGARGLRDTLLQIIDHSGDLISISDIRGRMTYLNEAGRKLIGQPSNEDLSKMRLTDFLYDDESSLEEVLSFCLEQKHWEFESQVRHQTSGAAIPVHSAGFLVYNDADDPVSIVTVTRDLTQVKRSESDRADLRDATARNERLESLGVLAGGVAHDMNNLLTGVLVNAGLALASVDSDSKAAWSIVRVEDAARQMTDLSNQLLAYASTHAIKTEAVDLGRLLYRAVESVNDSIPPHARFVFDVEPSVFAEINPTQVTQLVVNLILNAADSLPTSEGKIHLHLSFVDNARSARAWCPHLPMTEGILIEVRDTGCGMSEDVRQRIFEPFYSTKKMGRGLGLAAALGIVRSHSGEIHVHSEVGEGTTILIFIPGRTTSAPRTIESRPKNVSPIQRRMKILVVDDEPIPRESVMLLLRHRGHMVIDAADGNTAIERIEEFHGDIDVALIDLNMPDMNGIELFKKIRQKYPEMRGVLCSGYPRSHSDEHFGEAGFDEFVQKPYEIDTIVFAVQGVAKRSAVPVAPLTSNPPGSVIDS